MTRRKRDRPVADRALYLAYMASPAWARRRRRSLVLAGHRCQYEYAEPVAARCHRTHHLEVHHLTYERLGHEADEDLEVLCWTHHMVEHLMWWNCPGCGDPLLRSYASAEAWLRDYLIGEQIKDADRVAGRDLPRKFALEAALPERCCECEPDS